MYLVLILIERSLDVKKFISSIALSAEARKQLKKAPKAAAIGIGAKNARALSQLILTAIKQFSGFRIWMARRLGNSATKTP